MPSDQLKVRETDQVYISEESVAQMVKILHILWHE
jgi:hypothetical protein